MISKQISGWKASKAARKQHLYRILAPSHLRRKLISANLNKEFRKKYQRRSLPLRKNDVVRIMRGQFKNVKGKVIEIDSKNLKVFVEGVLKKKNDGSKVPIALEPSNLQIIELAAEDKKRIKALERKSIIKK